MVTWCENGSLPKMYRLKTMIWRMSVVLGDKIFFFSAGGGGVGGRDMSIVLPMVSLKTD